MFARHLLQLHGMSVEKVQAVVKEYSTPSMLLSSYEKCNSKTNQEKLLSELSCGSSSRTLGPVLSKTLCMFYNNDALS